MEHGDVDILRRRYGEAQGSTINIRVNPTISTLLGHVSTRCFLPHPLPEGTLETLMAAAQSASTGSMLQTWSCVAIQDIERKKHVSVLCGDQDFIRQAPLFLLWCADLSRVQLSANKHGVEAKAIDNMDMFVLANNDTAMAAQNAAIAAESMGLGFCYVGGARNNAALLSEYLRLPPRMIGLFGMAVGHPNPTLKNGVKPRLPIDEVVYHEEFSDSDRAARIERYNKTLNEYYIESGKRSRGPWTEHMANFVATGRLDGRERFRTATSQQKFGLE